MTKPTLVYFAGRGRAEVIRLVLAEAGVEYDEQLVTMENFPAMKKSGELPFGAVPAWREGDFTLAQSSAIANYLARQHGLYPKDAKAAAKCDEILGAVDDIRTELRKIQGATPEARPQVREQIKNEFLPRWFGYLERFLGNKKFVTGEELTVADLALWYTLELIRDNHLGTAFADYMDRIAKRPGIAAYLASSKRYAFTPFPA
jgi:glutathione S-transferase